MKQPLLWIMIFALEFGSLRAQILPDRHTTNAFDGWISCETTSPNPAGHPNSHWIEYDFGQPYALYDIIFWNMNHPDYLDDGLKNVLIQHSLDGNNWTSLPDTITIPKATGSGFYQGVRGPDLNGGVTARYVLITAIDNHGGGCYALSEIRFYTQSASTTEFVLDFSPCETDGIYQNHWRDGPQWYLQWTRCDR